MEQSGGWWPRPTTSALCFARHYLEQVLPMPNVILTAGACMDYVAGALPTPPRWMGQLGLEWLFRLLAEPGRLWRRYLLEPWFILGLVVRELWRKGKV